MAALLEVRLLKAYRGYRAGTVIWATAGLADHLVDNGTAVREAQASLLPADGRHGHERAVAQPQAAETR